ncbi:MAG: hypothetical protein RJA57_874 [Bacteroidota bacterium]|jgi:gas vesicle protein
MKNTTKILIALGAGAAIGGILGVLFAPDKGVNTRHKIADQGRKLSEKFKRTFAKKHEEVRVNGEMDEVV